VIVFQREIKYFKSPRIPIRNYHYTLRNIADDGRSPLKYVFLQNIGYVTRIMPLKVSVSYCLLYLLHCSSVAPVAQYIIYYICCTVCYINCYICCTVCYIICYICCTVLHNLLHPLHSMLYHLLHSMLYHLLNLLHNVT
jgi:hypothetical protein